MEKQIREKNQPVSRIKKNAAALTSWIWSHPDPSEPPWQRAARVCLRVIAILWLEFQRDRIPLRASALTFTVVLSMVPILALGTAVLKGLGAGDQMRQAAYSFIDQLEEPQAAQQVTPAPPASAGQPESGARKGQEGLTIHLRRAVDQIFDYVERTNFATLGAFGIFGLVITVISVLGSIEQSMNAIWQAAGDRPLGRKVMDYLALMILLPVSINLALATEATLQSPPLLERLRIILPVAWLSRFLLSMLPVLLVVATFTILYRFLPNTRVRVFPAMAGGAFGGIGWLLTQSLYVKLQIGVARYNAIYGSFATLPLLLMWIYIGWIIFLAGAETAFAAQSWQHYTPNRKNLRPIARLALAFNIMAVILADYRNRVISSHTSLSNRLRQPDTHISTVLNDLLQGGIIRKIPENGGGYLPAAPADRITPVEILDLILGTEVPPQQGSSLAIEALQAARRSLEQQTLTGRMHSQGTESASLSACSHTNV